MTPSVYANVPSDSTPINIDDNLTAVADTLSLAKNVSIPFQDLGVSSKVLADVANTGVNDNFQLEGQHVPLVKPINNSFTSTIKNNTTYLEDNPVVYNDGAHDPHIPQDTEEQIERIIYILNETYRLYESELGTPQFAQEACFLYLSHYTDNPAYVRCDNPDFDSYLCFVIGPTDRQAYSNYLSIGNGVNMANAILNIVDFATSNLDAIRSVNAFVSGESQHIIEKLEAAKTILEDFDPDHDKINEVKNYTNEVVISVKDALKIATTVEQLYQAANAVPKPDELLALPQEFVENIVLATLSLAFCGPSFGVAISYGVAMVEAFQTFYDYAAFLALKYTFSYRYAERFMIYYGI